MTKEPCKFVADAMLGSLARKLRVFGFDTAYFRDGEDSKLERLAIEEGRILLTSDRLLFTHARTSGLSAILVCGQSERARLESVVEAAALASISLEPGRTRCAVCNGELLVIRSRGATKGLLAGRVPEKILARHRVFFECLTCQKFYWKGRQWSKLRRLHAAVLRGRAGRTETEQH